MCIPMSMAGRVNLMGQGPMTVEPVMTSKAPVEGFGVRMTVAGMAAAVADVGIKTWMT